MLMNFVYGLLVLILCLMIQSMLLKAVVLFYISKESTLGTSNWTNFNALFSIISLLLVGNLIQIGVWGFLFLMLGEFPDFATAYYHSAVNFATLGYGDIVMSEQHRLLGPLESLNGIMMVGISSAALIAAVNHIIRKSLGIEEI